MAKKLTMLVHGESGVGKSYFADTAPAPRLIFDVEGGVRFTPSKKVAWTDPNQPPPEAETVVVTTTNLAVIEKALQWIDWDKHPFRSVILDSLSEAQYRYVLEIAGTAQPTQQQYGELLRKGEALVARFRDLPLKSSVEVVIFTCGSHERGEVNKMVRPALSGQLSEKVGYKLDVMMYLANSVSDEGEVVRKGLFVQLNGYAAKARPQALVDMVSMEEPTVPKILETMEDE